MGTLFALLTLAVLISVFFIRGLSADASRYADREVQYATALSAAALNAKGIANDERGFLLSGDDEFLVEIDIRTGVAREAFALAAQAADDAQSRRIVEVHESFERWLVAVEEDIATFRAGDREAARAASLGPTRELRKGYEAMLAEAAITESGVPSAAAAVSGSAALAIAILLGYLLLAAALILAIGVWTLAGLRRKPQG